MSKSLPDYQDPFKSESSLGTYTKLGKVEKDISALRVERWMLQSAARFLLNKFPRKDSKGRIQKKFRVVQCLRLPLSNTVPIKSKNNVAHYTKINVCGSVWTCPICATKITEGRRNELSQAVDYWKSFNGSVALVTTTIPHRRSEKLVDLLAKVQLARRVWRNRTGFKKSCRDFGIVGTIRSLEITYGLNGWHVHFHELYFYDCKRKGAIHDGNAPYLLGMLQAELIKQWRSAAESAGLQKPSFRRGLDVRNGDFAAAYVAKFGHESVSGWGVDQELTKGHIKQSRGGFSPFDMLRSFVQDGDVSSTAPSQYFAEYAFSTFGKSMLHWSTGLKRLLKVIERTDQELAEHVDTQTIHLGNLDLKQWRFILKNSLQGHVLEYANLGGFEAVEDYLRSRGYDKNDTINVKRRSGKA